MRTSTTSMPNCCASRFTRSRMRFMRVARSSRTAWMNVDSPSTRRSDELRIVMSRDCAPSIEPTGLVEAERISDAVARETRRPRAASDQKRSLPARIVELEMRLSMKITVSTNGTLYCSPARRSGHEWVRRTAAQRLLGLMDVEQRRVSDRDGNRDETARIPAIPLIISCLPA